MAFSLYNTLHRRIEPFLPLDPEGKRVRLYCCGPTIHDFAHIGNFRTFVLTDLLTRYLRFRGYEVDPVMNITDVEDKIIRRVRDAGVSLREFTAVFERAFFEDLEELGCVCPDQVPHATDFIDEIIELIQRLVDRGIAYQTADGSVYFSSERFQSA